MSISKFDFSQKLNAPLFNAVNEYVGKKPARFHMPSHKGVSGIPLYSSACYDVTELDFSDNLLQANGVIKEAEELIANKYGVDKALMCTGGATSGLFATLYCVSQKTKKIILSKNSHKSIYNAMSVMGLTPCFCDVSYDDDGIPNVLSANDILRSREKNPDAGAVLITSPDYFGRICDLEKIREASEGLLLVADAAHGGHFAYTKLLENRVERIADVTVVSVHKTLNCYTGSAIVLCKNEFYRILCRGRELFHSTSPQYLSMISMDYSRALFEKFGEKMYSDLKAKLGELNLTDFENYDFCKIMLRGGESLSDFLKDRGIYPECVYGDFVLLIATPFDMENLEKVKKALVDFERGDFVQTKPQSYPKGVERVPFQDCFSRPIEYVPISQAVGRVLGAEVGLYPPGTPVFVRGEELSEEGVEFLLNWKKSLFGVDSDCICVLK